MTRVEISYGSSTGPIDIHYINTDDRGLAAKTVMAIYGRNMEYLNWIKTGLRNAPSNDTYIVLEPINDTQNHNI